MIFTKDDLDEFVITVDSLFENRQELDKYWAGFDYIPEVVVNQNLDPYSDEYLNAQIALYEELSGVKLNQYENEMTVFPLEDCVRSANPYGSSDVQFMSKHSNSITTALKLAQLPRCASILDMGSGWGLSSEVMAFCGARVTAVDINPKFVELNRRRAEKFNLEMNSVVASFEDFQTDEKFDAVFFYECLHHAVKPWETIKKYKDMLKDDGKLILSGEPVNQNWWKNWGLRLDPMSIYCIRKHGWFESGWSNDFLMKMLADAGLNVERHVGVGVDNSDIYIAKKSN